VVVVGASGDVGLRVCCRCLDLERGGKIKVEVVPNVRAETLLREVIGKVRRGSLI